MILVLQKKRVKSLEQKVANLENKLSQSEAKYGDLKDEFVKLEMYSRRRNLKFLNIKDPHSSSSENCEEKILDLCAQFNMALDATDIEVAHRLGRGTKTDRPILVRFHSLKNKQKILKERKRFQEANVRVIEDFPLVIQQRRRVFAPVMQAIFKSGGKYKGNLIQDKLLLNDRMFTVKDLDNLPDDLKLHNLSTKTNENMVVFFSRNSKFSNHHPCCFTKDEVLFTSVEQYLMFRKAKCFKDSATADLVLQTDDPVKAKQLGKTVKDFQVETWREVRNRFMEEGLSAKFNQNPELKKALKDTGSKIMVEANPRDTYWGVGLSLDNDEIWNSHNWKGKNILGKLLVELRQTFQ